MIGLGITGGADMTHCVSPHLWVLSFDGVTILNTVLKRGRSYAFPPTWPVFPMYVFLSMIFLWIKHLDVVSSHSQETNDVFPVNHLRVGPNGQTLEQECKFVVKHVLFCGLGSPKPPMPYVLWHGYFQGRDVACQRTRARPTFGIRRL